MDKLPAKQIYLLSIIVFGIITLSVYSTYSIFTLESVSDDIVSIHTPNDLNILNSTYEYQQVIVPGNSYITTDLDIYNNMNEELCYGVWYKIVSSNDNVDKIKVYENTANSLLTNSVISGISNRRISILITNDNLEDVKVNIGLIYSENNGTCELNIPNDKSQVIGVINNPKNLSDTLINSVNDRDNEEGYLTYSYKDKNIVLNNDDMIYISNNFNLKDELFELNKMEEDNEEKYKEIKYSDIINYQDYYTCFKDTKCDLLYHIKNVNKDNDDKYIITDYDILVPYMDSVVGLRKVNNDYYYYGDNPDNFVYYNCTNELDNKTCELWRIIGFTYDNGKYLTKLIRNDSIGKYKYDNQIWDSSSIRTYLNNDYKLNNVSTLKEYSFKQENIINNDINYLDNVNKDKVLLMNLSDYLNTSVCTNKKINEYIGDCISKNWLNNKLIDNEYTLSVKYQEKKVDEDGNEITPLINDIVYSTGNSIIETNISDELNIRPVVYLSSRTLLTDGFGTFENPYVLR